MTTFFSGWRRKLGVPTLVMACLFAAAWARSLIIGDILQLSVHETTYQYASNGGIFYIESLSPDGLQPTKWRWKTTPVNHASEYDFFNDGAEYEWLWVSGKFLCYKGKWKSSATIPTTYFSCAAAPYWSIVLPLTLLSAYVLLSKQRAAKPVATAEN